MFTGLTVFNSSLFFNEWLFSVWWGFSCFHFKLLFTVLVFMKIFPKKERKKKKKPTPRKGWGFFCGMLFSDINFWLHEFMYARL